ncbi:hypothetical protein BUALT_Bualt02G0118100 [Buddleja alternifolia]|uniref:Malic enzyme n=1 Tax=Buddleja alternifolia TaxID=168488 RepID=A0AAV6Y5R1_9LAMI|nr:hypothetical protein BUALT_Bualt02G0118100 [Buddleja alternifolia]
MHTTIAEMAIQRMSSSSGLSRNEDSNLGSVRGVAPKRGMVLPFTPLAMAFDSVNYYVDMPPEMKGQGVTEDKLQLLCEVTGAFRPGVLTALMGVSGAGKTTLMDVLAGRKTGGYIEGDIRISGFPKNQETFARISGYCEQNDIHSPQVTVRESLIYSAFLRLPKEVTKEQKMAFVDEVMDLVELENLKDAIVGISGVTGLSTEQRKRLTIAVELVANPSIIFMDEPTSGLDARAAAIVMRTVRNTVDTGRTVVCTIHQPSIDIFEAFDELLLMKRGGQVIYAGPLGQHSQKIIEYFEAIPGVPKIKEKYNPATWMLEASSVAAEARLGIDFAEYHKTTTLHQRNKALVKELSVPAPGAKDLYFDTEFSQPVWGQFKSCLWKQWWTYWRSPDYNLVRYFFTLACALLVGTVFWRVGTKKNSDTDLLTIIGAMYASVLFVGINNCSTVQPVVAIERTVFYRERAAGMYSALPYAMAQVIVEIPYVLIQTTYYTLIVYAMVSFEWTAAKFFWFYFVNFFSFLYFTYYGMMTVSITPNHQVAAIFAAAFYALFNLFSGFFIPRPNNSICGVSKSLTQRKISGPPSVVVVASVSSNGKPGDRNATVLMENTLKEMRENAPSSSSSSSSSVVEKEPESTVGGGVEDVYGEDSATEDQYITPWTVTVASGYQLLRDPHHNKGLAFKEKERDAHFLRGLLPPVVISQEIQVKKMMHNMRQYQVPLQRYMAMMDLQERNERLFYKLLIDNVEELLPVVYTPTVGEACQKYGSIFRQPQGLFISLKEKGRILEVLRNWPEKKIQVIVVTDGERILGLGDLGCQGMGIPVGKLSLYSALGGIRPSACLPVTIDVGTNNEQLLNDEFYIGLRRRRATGQEYAELLHEFMSAVKQNYGEKVLIQFEDFANHNAFDLLAKYGTTHLVFNDDIQGTASVVLAGLMAALNLVGGALAEHRFLFLGAGEAGTGIAELIALEMSKQTDIPVEETRKKIWLVDSKGLIVKSRLESLQHFKRPWAHEHEPVTTLLDAVKAIKPTVLIGSSGAGRTFTKEVVEAMSSLNEKPVILALSNPTSQSECTAEEAYKWSEGRAIFASGSPFSPVEYNGKFYASGQANNAYIFPGFGLGLIISGAIRVHDDMLLEASEALAEQVSQENFDNGLIYPPFSNIRKISAQIAARVAAKAYELGKIFVLIIIKCMMW